MKKLIIMTGITFLTQCAWATSIFEDYKKKLSFGYIDYPTIRYWMSDKYGFDVFLNYENNNSVDNDSASARKDKKEGMYALTLGSVYKLKEYDSICYNLMLQAGFFHTWNNEETQTAIQIFEKDNYFIQFGPETELKVPYFSHLVITSQILLKYHVGAIEISDKDKVTNTYSRKWTINGKGINFVNNGNTLTSLLQLGIRYYF